MSCKLSDKCDNVFACNILRPNVELLGCNFYKPKKPMPNEEYLKSCDTEKLAEFIVNLTLLDKYKLYDRMEAAEYEQGIGVGAKKVIVEWLKEKYDG